MVNYIEKIKEKIISKLNPDRILIIDNSHLHTKHKSFSPDKFHLKFIIKSEKLKKMKKIDSHKLIFSILRDEMREKIHALEIEIE
tara:strand:+ start:903 stop:1157 length:255 start_codon:yes stop_codon:yes gene_type:complete